ncbi:RidA family protein [Bosea sp. (in: a-proteobacteria)]|uniref:RidA family protein n=1 Tax=Bosea sp. (in: a-proteobacteria) TaxID=1871050 RepID=UPI0026310E50|nr:RidA family protein [Bosea sp. (in: a-proteobacteria)]MCO5089542.1 RidA family protein [Bosea sp. (in: a-proteobacteria)]
MSVSSRLKELGLTLQPTTPAIGSYVPATVAGSLIFCSGATCMVDGRPKYRGKIGREITIEQGNDAARIAALNMLQKIADVVGDVDRVGGILKLVGHLNCTSDFISHAAVVNGASDLLVEIFGDRGRHARLSLGANSLPNDVPLEIEVVAFLAEER